MEEDAEKGAEGAEPPVSADGIPPLPPELSTKEQELRAMVDAGAASPEELRELAAKLKEQRTYERSLWQSEVRPALMQAKKKRFSLVDLRRDTTDNDSNSNSWLLGGLLAAGVLVLVFIAAQTSFLILLVAVVAVLVYAWVHGLRGADLSAPESPPPDTGD